MHLAHVNYPSLLECQTLSGCVESVEDHGYLVDIGVGETKAFLPKQAAKDQQNNPEGTAMHSDHHFVTGE